jgi:hypothetical protein
LYRCAKLCILPAEEVVAMSGGPFLNIKASRTLMERLDDYRYATRKPSRAEAARELLDWALKAFFEASRAELVRRGDPDYALARARRRQPTEALPIREIEARLARLKRVRAG